MYSKRPEYYLVMQASGGSEPRGEWGEFFLSWPSPRRLIADSICGLYLRTFQSLTHTHKHAALWQPFSSSGLALASGVCNDIPDILRDSKTHLVGGGGTTSTLDSASTRIVPPFKYKRGHNDHKHSTASCRERYRHVQVHVVAKLAITSPLRYINWKNVAELDSLQ